MDPHTPPAFLALPPGYHLPLPTVGRLRRAELAALVENVEPYQFSPAPARQNGDRQRILALLASERFTETVDAFQQLHSQGRHDLSDLGKEINVKLVRHHNLRETVQLLYRMCRPEEVNSLLLERADELLSDKRKVLKKAKDEVLTLEHELRD